MLKARLLASSFAPMAFIIAVRVIGTHPLWACLLVLLGIGAIGSGVALLAARGKTNAQPYTVTSIRDESPQVPAYLLTYIFPFMFVSMDGWQNQAAYGVFAILLVIIMVQTDLVLVNPIFLAAGYHLYVIESTSGYRGFLLASTRPLAGQTIEASDASASQIDRSSTAASCGG